MSDFDSVGDFHEKFGLPNATHARPKPAPISPELRDFRLKFILEELAELCEGYGLELSYAIEPIKTPCPACGNDFELAVGCPECSGMGQINAAERQDLAKIADALVDLSYVVLGAAHVHGLPWAALFAEVQRANITKERCGIDHHHKGLGEWCEYPLDESTVCGKHRSAHSLRGSAFDVIKPAGWAGPDIVGVLTAAGWPGPELPLRGEAT